MAIPPDPKEQENLPLAEIIALETARHQRVRRTTWLIIGAVVLAAGISYLFLRPTAIPLDARFRMQPVSTGNIVREVRATGNVNAVTTVQVGAEVSGRIAQVPVDFNSIVHVGDVLARFDLTLLRAQAAQAEASTVAARSALSQAISDRDHVERDLLRSKELFTKHLLAAQELDADTSSLRLANERVEAARWQLGIQQAALDYARTNLRHGTIYAPIDGIVVARNVDSGQTVASVFQTPVLFSVAADLKKMQVIAAVDEADIGELREGQDVSFTVNAYSNRIFQGIVTQVRNSPSIVQDVVTYGAVINVDNSDLALKPGMTASVRIVTAHSEHCLKVPSSALHFTPPGETSDTAAGVWVIERGAFRRIPVTAGISDGEWTQVSEGALQAGQRVLVELTTEGKKAYAAAPK